MLSEWNNYLADCVEKIEKGREILEEGVSSFIMGLESQDYRNYKGQYLFQRKLCCINKDGI